MIPLPVSHLELLQILIAMTFTMLAHEIWH